MFAGPEMSLSQLQAVYHIIVRAIEAALLSLSTLSSCLNVKWSKGLINAVPTGVTEITLAHSQEACHQALLCHNPSYCCLCIMQLPSWVKCPSLLLPHSSSSLVMAFEDPDSSILSSLLLQCYLFGFVTQLSVYKWHPPLHTPNLDKMAAANCCQQRLMKQANDRNLVHKDPAVTASTAAAHTRASQPPVPKPLTCLIPLAPLGPAPSSLPPSFGHR